jgi:hypothetical protein
VHAAEFHSAPSAILSVSQVSFGPAPTHPALGDAALVHELRAIRKLRLKHLVKGQSAVRSSVPAAGVDNFASVPLHDVIIFGATQMNIDENAVLRLRICGYAGCRAAFTICVSCDRGQRYCSPECRSEVRRRQRHEANRRYQQSELGRESHRRCQQRYRERASQPPVTDQGVVAITSAAPPQPPTVCQCTICGRHSLWIDPFPTIPRQWRRGWRSSATSGPLMRKNRTDPRLIRAAIDKQIASGERVYKRMACGHEAYVLSTVDESQDTCWACRLPGGKEQPEEPKESDS